MPGFFVQAEWLWEEILPDPFLCLQEILKEQKMGDET